MKNHTIQNIVLIGMPASGKSTIGVELAKQIGFEFVDTDLLIQNTKSRSLERIISDGGIDTFLKLEEDICNKLYPFRTVIATGGSVVYSEQAMRHLKAIGTIIYLKVSLTELSARIGNLKQRGVVFKSGQTFKELYDERTPLYEKWADLTIESGMIESTISTIMFNLSDHAFL